MIFKLGLKRDSVESSDVLYDKVMAVLKGIELAQSDDSVRDKVDEAFFHQLMAIDLSDMSVEIVEVDGDLCVRVE